MPVERSRRGALAAVQIAIFMTALLPTSSPARAYSTTDRFDQSAESGGGGGRWFTGSPRDGFTCAVCHDSGRFEARMVGVPENGYEPGARYLLAVGLDGAVASSAMSLEVTDENGAPVGTLAALDAGELEERDLCGDGTPGVRIARTLRDDRPVAATPPCGVTVGRVAWTAPEAGMAMGPVFVHGAIVRGDASASPSGDPVAEIAVAVPVAGAPPPESVVSTTGCSTVGAPMDRTSGQGGLAAVCCLVLLCIWRRRRGPALGPRAGLSLFLLFAFTSDAHAVPGPATTAVLANSDVPGSVTLAERYAAARSIPAVQVCSLPMGEDIIDLDLEDFRTLVKEPLEICLDAAGVRDRIEAVLLTRGVPLRVGIPDGGTVRRVSLAAALGLGGSTNPEGELLGSAPGVVADCGGTPCYAARLRNPYTGGTFEPGWERMLGDLTFRPLLVTMLHGRSDEEAAMLLDSALAAEADGPADGEFLFMDGRDPARGALDREYPAVIATLEGLGYTDVARVPFDAELTGRTLAAFFTGTATIGATIEGNTFAPGALVDNLTSFGAVPENFDPDPGVERQVSIARWVARGVAGVHGTTDEPLNSVFPSRALIVDYVGGATLAEAYHQNLPNVYWRNLVLGDPMAAPYAVRPVVSIDNAMDGDVIGDARDIVVSATDSEGFGIETLSLYRDGALIDETEGDTLTLCLDLADGASTTLLAVAQKRDDGSDRGLRRPKGWLAITLRGGAGRSECGVPDAGPPPVDGGGRDGATDAGPPPTDEAGGCGCTASDGGSPITSLGVLAAVLLWRRRTQRA